MNAPGTLTVSSPCQRAAHEDRVSHTSSLPDHRYIKSLSHNFFPPKTCLLNKQTVHVHNALLDVPTVHNWESRAWQEIRTGHMVGRREKIKSTRSWP